VVRIGDDGRRRARAFRVLDHLRLAAFHDGDAAVGGSEVDSDDLGHDVLTSALAGVRVWGKNGVGDGGINVRRKENCRWPSARMHPLSTALWRRRRAPAEASDR